VVLSVIRYVYGYVLSSLWSVCVEGEEFVDVVVDDDALEENVLSAEGALTG
jgi:hypothetical protein